MIEFHHENGILCLVTYFFNQIAGRDFSRSTTTRSTFENLLVASLFTADENVSNRALFLGLECPQSSISFIVLSVL